MRSVYRVIAYLIAIEVAVQAAMMAFAVAGLALWVDGGGVFDKAAFDNPEDLDFAGLIGIPIHGLNGMFVIPALALILLIVSFFARVPKGVLWAGLVLLAVVVQVMLGLLGHEEAIFGLLHGANALILFWLALTAGRRVRTVTAAAAATTAGERERV